MITKDQLKELLSYNPETGIFMWMESPSNNIPAGSAAGTPNAKGYIVISIDNRLYLAHRLAILYTDGYLPENTVDHKDRVPWHNWRSNLREATQQCQLRNCGMNSRNTSGVKGISRHRPTGKWRAQIMADGGNKHLGLFDGLLDAAYTRYAAEQCLGFQDCDISSSARRYIKEMGGVC